MKKLLVLVCILGMLVCAGNAISGDNPELDAIAMDSPRVIFKASSTKIIRVHTFYDTKLATLCYVTQNSIWCIPYHNLQAKGREQINELVDQAPKDILKRYPNIIKIH